MKVLSSMFTQNYNNYEKKVISKVVAQLSFDNNEDVVDINICTLLCDIHLNL